MKDNNINKSSENSYQSAKETIRQILEKKKENAHRLHSPLSINSAENLSNEDQYSRQRVSKKSKPIKTVDRQSVMNSIIKNLVFGTLTQGSALKTLRIDVLGLKQDAYAKLVSVSRKTLSEIENDKGNYSSDIINKVFKPFGLKVGLVPTSRSLMAALLKELD